MVEDSESREESVIASVVPAQRRLDVDYDVRARPEADSRTVTVEFTGGFGALGLELTATQASDLASRLNLAAHTDD